MLSAFQTRSNTVYILMQDPFDKQRIQALNDIKSEGKAWIAAHAKGGSAPGMPPDCIILTGCSFGAAPIRVQRLDSD